MGQQTLFFNGKITTANPERPDASAFVVEDGRITWIGADEGFSEAVDARVDLEGKRVIPGILDGHMHPLLVAHMLEQVPCMPPDVYSIADLIEQINLRKADLLPGEWIEGWGYDEAKLAEKRTPNRYDLDKASTEIPIVLTRTCGHIASVNSKALELAGIDRNTEDVDGGEIERDEHGEPTGVLKEHAKGLVTSLQTRPTQTAEAEKLAALSDVLLAHGITGVTDMSARSEPIDFFALYNEAVELGMKQRIGLYYTWNQIKDMDVTKAMTDPAAPVFIAGVKLFADGSVSGRTAWVDEPYEGDADAFGISTTSEDELVAATLGAREIGIQLSVHAMGGRAIDQVLRATREIEPWMTEGPSIRIEHVSFPTDAQMNEAVERGIAFVPQPIFLYAEIDSYLEHIGVDRTERSYPLQTMIDAGVQLALSSDAPATSWSDPTNPYIGMEAAVTRKAYNDVNTGQDERISIEDAIDLYTREAQVVTSFPNVGMLAVGKQADFVILDQDIQAIDPSAIGQTKPLATYMNGEIVYKRT